MNEPCLPESFASPGTKNPVQSRRRLAVVIPWLSATAVVLEWPQKCHRLQLAGGSGSEGQAAACTPLWLALHAPFLSNIE